ncbi:uncharacterized protein KD926_000941 [Aspergillus affinis]|uniref:uncharacterized protein n=1 Tax=Aspergillus affinis TaxID=1070780 RepID=UPI0022FE8C60|nr:uncharacterized protein KD926_000941 [Aspergillus affinis]KAI9044340.1 hypothetical protein KD926_000941 [Aspergillus affinis]
MSSIDSPQGVANDLPARGLIAVTWVGVALGILFAGTRILIRMRRMNRLLVDDYFVLLALAFLITNAALQTIQTPHLYYTALTPTGPEIEYHGNQYVRYEFAIIGLFWSVLWSIKGSFLALFWKLTEGIPRYRWACCGVGTFAMAAYTVCWMLLALSCHPPQDYFHFGNCNKPNDQRSAFITICFSTTVDIITDVMSTFPDTKRIYPVHRSETNARGVKVMAIGLSIIWNTGITRRQKLGLGVVFGLGLIIIAAAIARAVLINDKAYSDIAGVAIWSVAEASLSMIVCCLPPFKIFVSNDSGYTSRYDHSGGSKRKSLRPSSWADVPLPLPLQERQVYRNLDYELHARDTNITGGKQAQVEGKEMTESRVSFSDDERPGEIRMVKEFSLVTTS